MGFFISDDQKAKLKKSAEDSASRLRRTGRFEMLFGAGIFAVSVGFTALTGGLFPLAMPLATVVGLAALAAGSGAGRFSSARVFDDIAVKAGAEGQFSDLSARQVTAEKIHLAGATGTVLGLVSFFTSSLFPPVAPLMLLGGVALAAAAQSVAETARTTKYGIAGYLTDLIKVTECRDSAAAAPAQPEAAPASAAKSAAPEFNAAAPAAAVMPEPAPAAAPKPPAASAPKT